jgi:hypothetical protein
LEEFFAEGDTLGFGRLPISRYETVEKGHGRIENRRALWITELSWLDKSPTFSLQNNVSIYGKDRRPPSSGCDDAIF